MNRSRSLKCAAESLRCIFVQQHNDTEKTASVVGKGIANRHVPAQVEGCLSDNASHTEKMV